MNLEHNIPHFQGDKPKTQVKNQKIFPMITLEKAYPDDVNVLHAMQIRAFSSHLEKYQDETTNPACDPLEKTLIRVTDPLRLMHHDLLLVIEQTYEPNGYRIQNLQTEAESAEYGAAEFVLNNRLLN